MRHATYPICSEVPISLSPSLRPRSFVSFVQVTPLPRNSAHAMIAVQVDADNKDLTEQRTVLWHFDTAPPPAGSLVVVLCNLPNIKHQVRACAGTYLSGRSFASVIFSVTCGAVVVVKGFFVKYINEAPTCSRSGALLCCVPCCCCCCCRACCICVMHWVDVHTALLCFVCLGSTCAAFFLSVHVEVSHLVARYRITSYTSKTEVRYSGPYSA